MSQPLIQVKDLSCHFGRKSVLADISIDFADGESVVIAGKNGAGKSTFLRCLTGVLLPGRGRVDFGPEIPRRSLGFISDRLSLFEDMTLQQAIRFHLNVYRLELFDDRLFRSLNLSLRTRIVDLSAGERVIFHLSLVLSQKPRILLIDEVLHQMDPYTRELLLEALIETLAENRTTLIMVNHTFTEVERIPERVLIMEKGQFVVDEKNEELRRQTKRVVVATAPLPEGLPVIYKKESGIYKEYSIYPFREEMRGRFALEFQELSLAEVIKAFIGGYYVQERMERSG